MDGLRFASPYLLVLLALVPALAFAARWRRGDASAALRIGSAAAAAAVPRTWKLRLDLALIVLRLLAVALLVFAVARPQRGEAESVEAGEGVDIVLAFDVSSSMTQPFGRTQSRLDAAKSVLSEFIASRGTDRVGLVIFKGSSLTLSPLTADYAAVEGAVQGADTIDLADGTAIGNAIAESVNVLRESHAASRVVILLTDGENNVHEIEPLTAARIAERLGVRVYTIGVVSRVFGQTRSTTNVDERALERIAEVTRGAYNRAEDQEALAGIYSRIDELEKSRVEGRVFTRYDEFAPWLLAAAAAALAIELALRSTLLRRVA
ncbi:MAG: VWA domain-containing protein [Dehalococcoidia bacterium]